MRRFFFYAYGFIVFIEFNHSISLRIGNMVRENDSAFWVHVLFKQLLKARSVKNIIPKDQRHFFFPDKFLSNYKGLCKSIWYCLCFIAELTTDLVAITQKRSEMRKIMRSRNDEDLIYSRHH